MNLVAYGNPVWFGDVAVGKGCVGETSMVVAAGSRGKRPRLETQTSML